MMLAYAAIAVLALAIFCFFTALFFRKLAKRERIDFYSFNNCTTAFENFIFVSFALAFVAIVLGAKATWH